MHTCKTLIVILLAMVGITFSASTVLSKAPDTKEPPQELRAIIETSKGTINIELFANKTPYTVANFVNLANRGYYNGLKFHRVIPNFMIQGGCPHGTGTGDPGYKFQDECLPNLVHDAPGILSMANSGQDTNGSQFFITHVPTPWLNGKHTVFGKVLSSLDMYTVNNITKGDTIKKITIEGDTTALMKKTQDKVKEWNKILDKKYPVK